MALSYLKSAETVTSLFDYAEWSGRQVIPPRIIPDKGSDLSSIPLSLSVSGSTENFLEKILKSCAHFTGQGELCAAYRTDAGYFYASIKGELLNIGQARLETVPASEHSFKEAGFRIIFNALDDSGSIPILLPPHPQLTLVVNQAGYLSFTPDYTESYLRALTESWRDPQPGLILEGKQYNSSSLSLYERFCEQAKRQPQSIALQDGNKQLSWRQLDQWVKWTAQQLAGEIPRLSCVALALPKSIDLVVATLACNAAGMTAMPLVEDLPLERLRHQLQNADCRQVLGQLPQPIEGVTVRGLPQQAPAINVPLQPLQLDEINTLYYTSGSEGKPKGVMLPGRAFHRLAVDPGFCDIRPGDVFGYFSNPAFDASALDVWMSMLNGLPLVLFQRDALLDLERFERQVTDKGVNNGFFTTGLFHRIADLKPNALSYFRQVFFGGEKASATAVRRAITSCPETRFIHAYGPTENGVFTSCQTLDAEHVKRANIAIGRPITGTDIVLVDDQLQPVANGYVGHLLCLGAGLATGYINEPALTAERFIDWRGRPAYLSGDLARINEFGEIEYIGRMDAQIKLNGYRIEPGEIEAALCTVPGISRAYVRLDEKSRQLQAWVTPANADLDAAREACRQLPRWMRPAQLTALVELPLNSNGKVDQKALHQLDLSRTSAAPAKPLSSLQQTLLQLYSEILQRPVDLPDASLFELGGNSLHLMSLLTELRERWPLPISLEMLAAQSAPGEVAQMIELLNWHEQGKQNTEQVWEF